MPRATSLGESARRYTERVLRRVLASAGVLLGLFHVWLFAGQILDGRLDDPAQILRWLVAGGLVAGLAGLRRRGLSIVRGRPAATIWLLAALLHGPAFAARIDDGGALGLPEVAATLSQLAVAAVAAIGLGLLVRLRQGYGGTATSSARGGSSTLGGRRPRPISLDVLRPRPPPAIA